MKTPHSVNRRLAACSVLAAAALLPLCAPARATVAPLQVSKTASGIYTRTYTWEISKSVAPTELTLAVNESAQVQYTVDVTRSLVDSWAVVGEISIYNPHSGTQHITSLTDVFAGNPATVDCGAVLFPYNIAGDGTLTCSYSITGLSGAANGTNTASAVIANGNTFSGSAQVVFGTEPTIEGYECVSVTDSLKGPLGQVCADPASFTYDWTIGPFGQPDVTSFPNTATIVETGHSADATVRITVEGGGSVPAPATLALVGIGLAGLGVARRHKAS